MYDLAVLLGETKLHNTSGSSSFPLRKHRGMTISIPVSITNNVMMDSVIDAETDAGVG